jgi:hypothetical protein
MKGSEWLDGELMVSWGVYRIMEEGTRRNMIRQENKK